MRLTSELSLAKLKNTIINAKLRGRTTKSWYKLPTKLPVIETEDKVREIISVSTKKTSVTMTACFQLPLRVWRAAAR